MEGTIGEIRMFASNFAPKSWSFCQGQVLPIASNTALFSLLGSTYGGNGTTTFGLPNLMGRAAIGQGTGPGLSSYALGDEGGTSNVTLTTATMPSHNHVVSGSVTASAPALASSSDATTPEVGDKQFPATAETAELYTAIADDVMGAYQTQVSFPSGLTVGSVGAAIPFSTLDPTLAVYYIICMFGIYPARN